MSFLNVDGLSKIYDTIFLIDKIIFSFVLFLFLMYFLFTIIKNIITSCKYKREKRENYKKFFAKRCFEESIRDNIYLIDNSKKYYRIVNLYTLGKLGYPRPSRDDKDCFNLSDGYTLVGEIKIYNLFSDIKDIIKLKSEL